MKSLIKDSQSKLKNLNLKKNYVMQNMEKKLYNTESDEEIDKEVAIENLINSVEPIQGFAI